MICNKIDAYDKLYKAIRSLVKQRFSAGALTGKDYQDLCWNLHDGVRAVYHDAGKNGVPDEWVGRLTRPYEVVLADVLTDLTNWEVSDWNLTINQWLNVRQHAFMSVINTLDRIEIELKEVV